MGIYVFKHINNINKYILSCITNNKNIVIIYESVTTGF